MGRGLVRTLKWLQRNSKYGTTWTVIKGVELVKEV